MHGLGKLLLFHIVSSLGQNVHGIIHGKKPTKNAMQCMASVQNEMGNRVCGGFLVRNDFAIIAAYCLNEEVKLKVHGSDILHEEKVPENSMQYMVSLQNKWGHHVCGGFLVSEDFVITAAHCAKDDPVSVVLGTHKLSHKRNLSLVKIEHVCKYPTYEAVGLGKDIMLLKLSRKAPLNNGVKTIPLPTSSNANLEDCQICSVAGWGKTGNNLPMVDDLRYVNVSILNAHLCREEWGAGFPSNVICAGGYDTDKGFCQGDNGGPLVCDGVAVGVVSFNRNFNCNYPDVPNVYTDISKYLEWINNIMKTKKCV